MNSTEVQKLKIKELIVNRLNLKIDPSSIGNDTVLFLSKSDGGLGLDSVDALELAVTINNEFGVVVTDEDMGIFNSVNTIDEFIEKNK